jgi:predicted Zn-dependent protease
MTTPRSALRALVLIGCVQLSAVSCATNPATGEKMLSLVSESQEIQMGQQFSRQVEASLPLLDDPGLQGYVESVGLALAAVSERPRIPWSFKVVDDPVVNAFALPGGPVYLTRGILAYFSSEAEMAAVLGHEIGHITARHSVEQISRQQLAGLGLAVGSALNRDVARYSGLASQGLQVLFLSYGRGDEHESDMLGIRYAGRGGYDVRESVTMHEKLDRIASMSPEEGVPSWLSTHPSSADRIDRLQAIVDTVPAEALAGVKLGRGAYLAEVEGLVFGENPRQGFFRAELFLHPDLRFQVRFPRGWQTVNLPSVVGGRSPSDDAIVQLTVAEGENHRAAANDFFALDGVRRGQVARETINGLPATIGAFEAQTDQGDLEGIAAFLDYGDLTYRIMGYTVSGRLGSYRQTFLAYIRSFRELTDPAALAVEPMRIELYTLNRETSIAGLARRKASPISPERLAVLNGVTEDAPLPAGTTIKWVVGERPGD